MKIKVVLHKSGDDTQYPLSIIDKGEWIDLRCLGYRNIPKDSFGLIPLGLSMKIPKGFEAIVAPRSSTFKNFGLLMANSIGVIDSSYSGTNDMWMFPYISAKNIEVNHGDRICQFRIQPSQKATILQKLKWVFSKKLRFEYVDSLDSKDRGGFGTTGV